MTKYFAFLIIFTISLCSHASNDSNFSFDDHPLSSQLNLPDWFKLSFLDLQESLQEANNNQRGLIIYFERKNCAYCKAQLDINWGASDIVTYTQKHFDVIAIDVGGQRTVTDFDGNSLSESEFADKMKTNFTPSFLIFDNEGKLALRLYGFRPPYQFRAALEYAIDKHYRKESFKNYLARAETAMSFGNDELNENDVFFSYTQPVNLNRSVKTANKPLAVFFEHPKCHACDVLHAGPMNQNEIIRKLNKMIVVQIDTTQNYSVVTPDGKQTTAKAWADQLELNFAPAIIFFDNKGHEIIRIESVVKFNRLNNVIQYVLEDGHLSYPTFQRWRERDQNEKR
ncbi:MAG: thioredoxin fold domain-containing protein [Gammaproteobacteria bacterium]|nr:thioredoxin fold domain-containing protein [Gammaproteobacteria bacterium]